MPPSGSLTARLSFFFLALGLSICDSVLWLSLYFSCLLVSFSCMSKAIRIQFKNFKNAFRKQYFLLGWNWGATFYYNIVNNGHQKRSNVQIQF